MVRSMSDLQIVVFDRGNQTGVSSCAKCAVPEELLMPQRGHGIHICGAASRDVAREQGDAHGDDADSGIGRWIRGLHVIKL